LADKHHWSTLESTLQVAASAAPGGPMVWHLETPGPTFDRSTPIISFISLAGVAACFLLRFGRSSLGTGRGGLLSSSASVGKLKPAFRSQLSALAWKQMRETGPLAILALAAVLAMSAVGYLVVEREWKSFSGIFVSVGAGMTFLVVIVAGIGVFLEDFQPNVSHFWRSRPTNPWHWFGVKYVSGMLVLVTILGIPLLLAAYAYWGSVDHLRDRREFLFGTLFISWYFVMAYSLAMTAHCLLRQPLYAAILTVLAIWLGSATFVWVLEEPHWTVEVGAMLLSLAGTITLGWLAVRNDWGWKR
jgi:hypothetical protein